VVLQAEGRKGKGVAESGKINVSEKVEVRWGHRQQAGENGPKTLKRLYQRRQGGEGEAGSRHENRGRREGAAMNKRGERAILENKTADHGGRK